MTSITPQDPSQFSYQQYQSEQDQSEQDQSEQVSLTVSEETNPQSPLEIMPVSCKDKFMILFSCFINCFKCLFMNFIPGLFSCWFIVGGCDECGSHIYIHNKLKFVNVVSQGGLFRHQILCKCNHSTIKLVNATKNENNQQNIEDDYFKFHKTYYQKITQQKKEFQEGRSCCLIPIVGHVWVYILTCLSMHYSHYKIIGNRSAIKYIATVHWKHHFNITMDYYEENFYNFFMSTPTKQWLFSQIYDPTLFGTPTNTWEEIKVMLDIDYYVVDV